MHKKMLNCIFIEVSFEHNNYYNYRVELNFSDANESVRLLIDGILNPTVSSLI